VKLFLIALSKQENSSFFTFYLLPVGTKIWLGNENPSSVTAKKEFGKKE